MDWGVGTNAVVKEGLGGKEGAETVAKKFKCKNSNIKKMKALLDSSMFPREGPFGVYLPS